MNRLQALEAVAAAARTYVAKRGMPPTWPDLIAAVQALDALPADPAPAQVVELAVWEHDDGAIQMVRCGTEAAGYTDGVGGWTRLGTTRLPLTGDGA